MRLGTFLCCPLLLRNSGKAQRIFPDKRRFGVSLFPCS
nr:MAG TPA: hypothetical protein [Caudoviricetes sp.]